MNGMMAVCLSYMNGGMTPGEVAFSFPAPKWYAVVVVEF